MQRRGRIGRPTRVSGSNAKEGSDSACYLVQHQRAAPAQRSEEAARGARRGGAPDGQFGTLGLGGSRERGWCIWM